MDKLNSMKTFVEVVNCEGFTAAANRIGLSRAQVSKSVMQLEAHLGARLLNRTTRRISLTEIGRIYYERCMEILHEIEEVEGLAGEQASQPRGTLTLAEARSDAYVQLARARVLDGRDSWGPMALVDGRLILRDFEKMICLDLR